MRISATILTAALGVSAVFLTYRVLVFVDSEARSVVDNLLSAVLVVLSAGLPIAAVVRLVVAPFSKRVRASIAHHKTVHIVWLIAAALLTVALVGPFFVRAKMRT